jgi:NACalpha-BTF3-like transcription factor
MKQLGKEMTEQEIYKILKVTLKHKDKEIIFREFRDMFMNYLLPVHLEEFTDKRKKEVTEKRKKEDDFDCALSEKISDGNMILEENEEDE